MKSNVKRPSKKRLENRIFMIGKESVDSHRIGKAVKESMSFITGQEECYPPVYDDMLEISANSVEHANKKTQDKNWRNILLGCSGWKYGARAVQCAQNFSAVDNYQ